ncbi:YadA C-terminal domain-containing protein [Megasphaera elsdenii]|uniref:YadA C-terminal domain-containing protein n=1 Tax=Megasphaera elsdenii TaxID=907 RepID=UPI003D0699C9
MKLSGKKLTTAILAGLMGATVAGISVVGAANPVVLNGMTLNVFTPIGTKPIMTPVNVTKGIIDGTTTEKGTIVKSGSTVGDNLNALDAAVVGKADKADLAAKADKADFDALKTKVDTAVHVSKDGNLIVGTKDNQVVNNAKINGKFTANNITAGGDIKAGGDITAGGKVTAAAVVDNTTQKGNYVKDNVTVGKNLDILDDALTNAKVDTAVHVSKDGNLIVGTKDNQVVRDAKINGKFTAKNIDVKENITAGGDITAKGKVTAAAVVDNTTKKGNYIKEGATVGNNLNILDDAINTNKEAIDANKNAIADNKKAADTAIQANKEAIATNTNAIAANTAAIGKTKDGNYVKAENSVGQNLNALDEQVGQNSANINRLFSDYSSLKTDINKVGARSAALAGLHPLDFDPANKFNFAVASGSFKGENSVALGAFYRPNENIMFSAASTMGDSDNAYTFGLSFKIGPSSAKTKTTSPDAEELYKVVGELQDQLAAQQKEIEQLKADKAK